MQATAAPQRLAVQHAGGAVMAQILMIVPPDQFRDEELFATRAELERAGHTVVIAGASTQPCSGMLGGRVTPDLTLTGVNPQAYAAVVFVGGVGVKRYYDDAQALQLARAMHASGKVVAAICLAPVVLANAGLLAGKRATVSGGAKALLQRGGAHYAGPGVVTDGNIITGDGPQSAERFARAINTALTPVTA
jgi:protease I